MSKIEDANVPKPKGVGKVDNPVESKPDFADRIIEAKEKAVIAQVVGNTLNPGGDGGSQKEDLATQIVTKSMDTQNKLIENMDKKTERMETKVEEANKSVASMQFELLQDQMSQLKETQKEAITAVKEAQAAGAPKDAFGYYTQVSGELEKLVRKVAPAQKAETEQKPGMSDTTQIRLKELELQQQQVLAQITADNTRAHEQFQLQMLEFKDNKEVRHMEYEDKRNFRQEGMQGVTDLVNAIGAGVSEKGGPGSDTKVTKKPGQQSQGEEAEAGAYVSSFKCGVCSAEVPVEEGQTVAKCPDCGAGFSIKAKG